MRKKIFLSKISIFLIMLMFLLPFYTNASFTDVTDSTKYKEAIEYLQEKSIVQGYDDNSFNPKNSINRAEFLKIVIVATLDKEILRQIENDEKYNNCFSDVKDEWFSKYVCYAVSKGIVNGYIDGKFRPEQSVNFVEASKIIAKSFGLDITEGEVWYEGYVKVLTENKRVPRTITAFDQDITRGEMAEMVWRVMEEVEKAEDWVSYNLLAMKNATTIDGWKTFISEKLRFQFQYPDKISVEEKENRVILYHSIKTDLPSAWCNAYERDKEDFKDFNITVQVFEGDIKEAVAYIEGDFVAQKAFINDGIDEELLSPSSFRGIEGYRSTNNETEGCGFFSSFYPIDQKRIFVLKDIHIPELSGISPELQEMYLQLPNIITSQEKHKLKSEILSTFMLLE